MSIECWVTQERETLESVIALFTSQLTMATDEFAKLRKLLMALIDTVSAHFKQPGVSEIQHLDVRFMKHIAEILVSHSGIKHKLHDGSPSFDGFCGLVKDCLAGIDPASMDTMCVLTLSGEVFQSLQWYTLVYTFDEVDQLKAELLDHHTTLLKALHGV